MIIDAEETAEATPVEDKPGAEEKVEKDTRQEIKKEPVRESETSQTNVQPAPQNFKPAIGKIVAAAPSVRRFAREIGVEITEINGSGPGGRISIDDVKAFSKKRHQQTSAGVVGTDVALSLPDFSKYGPVESEPLNKLRQTSARNLSSAWTTIPHVTQFDKADITHLEELRKSNGKKAEAAGGKLTMTAILVKVIEAALHKFPEFNASIDMANKQVIYKKYFHIGIAVDTERGLLVPVIKDVNKKNILKIAAELSEIAQKARDKKLTMDEMQGGNFSISNLGGIGGTGFTPIINSPDVAILGVSRAEMQPVYLQGEFKPRLIMPLSLSYDHRIIDGAAAARFLRWVCEVLEEQFNILLEG
jgi:pyruvate dehydrogenase E2 component (dihydrolipoamide acetyltransferase)